MRANDPALSKFYKNAVENEEITTNASKYKLYQDAFFCILTCMAKL